MALVQNVDFDNLVIKGAEHVGTLTLAAEQGELKKGTIVTAVEISAVCFSVISKRYVSVPS